MLARLKKISVAALVVALLIGMAAVVLPWVVDSKAVVDDAISALETSYGLQAQYEGEPYLKPLPSPKIFIPNVRLQSADNRPVLEAPFVILDMGWLGLLRQSATRVILHTPQLHVSTGALFALAGAGQQPMAAAENMVAEYVIEGGTLSITSPRTPEAQLVRNVSMQVTLPHSGGSGAIRAAGEYKGQAISLNSRAENTLQPKISGEVMVPNIGNLRFAFAREAENADSWKGDVAADIKNLAAFAALFSTIPAPDSAAAAVAPLPLSFDGKALVNADYFMLSRSEAVFDTNKSSIAFYLGWQKHISAALELHSETLKLDRLYQALAPYLMAHQKITRTGAAPVIVSPLSDSLNVSLILDVDAPVIGTKTYHHLWLAAEFERGDALLHHARMEMAGDTELTLAGKVTDQSEGRRFSGIAALEGAQLNAWLADIEPYAAKLPKEDFSNFSVAGNLFISKEQLRLSEATLKINEFGLTGGFATYFDKVPRVEAEIKLSNPNLDYFRDAWQRARQEQKTDSYSLLMRDAHQFDWLKRLPAILDFRVVMEGFRFLDTEGSYAGMRLYTSPGEFRILGLDMRFPENQLSGNVTFHVRGARPNLAVVLSATNFNTDYLALESDAADTPWFQADVSDGGSRWSENLFDVRWLSAMDGAADVSIQNLHHQGELYENFKWDAKLLNASMTIKRLAFSLLGGTFDLNGTFIGGKVPGLSASFVLYNANLKRLLQDYFNLSHISGAVNITGVVSTSGIHPKAWVQQGEMKLNTSARGVRVQGFDLQAVIDTVMQARSTTDVAMGVNNRIHDGVSTLSVDGSINIAEGIVRTPGIRLGFGRASGALSGEMELLPWTLNLTTRWQFPELSSSTIPTMSISHQGAIDAYETRIDTSSLEAFVAKRITQ